MASFLLGSGIYVRYVNEWQKDFFEITAYCILEYTFIYLLIYV